MDSQPISGLPATLDASTYSSESSNQNDCSRGSESVPLRMASRPRSATFSAGMYHDWEAENYTNLRHSETSTKSRERIRMIEPVFEAQQVRTERSIASIFLGVHSTPEHWFFVLAVENRASQACLWIAWLVGVIFGLLVILGILPTPLVWCSLMMLPLPLVAFFLLSKDIVMEVLMEIDFYVINILQVVLFFTAWHHLHDHRLVFWICYIPTLFVSTLVDAYPARFRTTFSNMFFIGMLLIFVIWNCIVIFKFKDWLPVTHHIGDNVTLFLFYIRHIWTAVFFPDTFILLKSSIHTFHEEVEAIVQDDGKRSLVRDPTVRRVLPPHAHSGIFATPSPTSASLSKTLEEEALA